MGNRAVITFGQDNNSPCLYLHWNGGLASVEAFLQAAVHLGLRRCETTGSSLADKHAEAMALDSLAVMIARHYFGEEGRTVHRTTYGVADTDNYDNGVYLLNRDMTIGARLFQRRRDEFDAEKTAAIFDCIVQRAPVFND